MRAQVFIPTFVVGASLATACFVPGFTVSDNAGTGGIGGGAGAGGDCTPLDVSESVVLLASQGDTPEWPLPTTFAFKDGTFTTKKGYTGTVTAGVLSLADVPADFFGWDAVELTVDDGCAEVPKKVELRLTPVDGGKLAYAADGTISGLSGPLSLGAADYNGDGVLDLVIGERDGASKNGLVHVVFGGPTLIEGKKSLGDLASSKLPGFVIAGPSGSALGASVSTAGDVNCSGRDSLILSAPVTGQAFVVYGETAPGVLDLSVDTERSFTFTGVTSTAVATDMSVAGGLDVSGDGVPDVVVGVPNFTAGAESKAGLTSVVFGGFSGCGCTGAGCLSSPQDLTNLGSSGFRILEVQANRLEGQRVALVGNVSGDGKADVAASCSTGRLDIVAGTDGTTDVDPSVVPESVEGNFQNAVGYSAAPASGTRSGDTSDFDADEVPDYAYCFGDKFGAGPNACKVVRGDRSDIDVSGFVLTGSSTGLGASVAYLGATNDDERSDLLFSEAGSAWVVFGTTGSTALNVTALGSAGYRLVGEPQANLTAVGLGDVDGDGFADFAVADAESGQVYVVRGGQ